jgi:Uncharacterized protein conserved in bacteria
MKFQVVTSLYLYLLSSPPPPLPPPLPPSPPLPTSPPLPPSLLIDQRHNLQRFEITNRGRKEVKKKDNEREELGKVVGKEEEEEEEEEQE